jgi:hypothetical protein
MLFGKSGHQSSHEITLDHLRSQDQLNKNYKIEHLILHVPVGRVKQSIR